MRKSILYLEDEAWQSVGSVSLALSIASEFDVQDCATIAQARAFLSERKWDAVLLDIGLNSNKPLVYEDTSFIVLNEIKEGKFSAIGNGPELPVIFASGVWDMHIQMPDSSRKRVSEVITNLGVEIKHCVSKPIRMDQLIKAIRRAILDRGGDQ